MWTDKRGFSPLEVLIALALILIGVLGIARFFPAGLEQARTANERTLASELADSRLSRLRFEGMENLFRVRSEYTPLYRFFAAYNTNAAARTYFGHANELSPLIHGYWTSVQRMAQANGVYALPLQRVVFNVELPKGRREQFVTYLAEH